MEQEEIEKLIAELDVTLDRLRSLYDQYFMGIERLEPAVVRKDVDRRVHALRREQIRNTALRFRFQMLLQRYSIFQAHWQRICREIDNGTYKRHMTRAQQRFGNEGSSRPAEPPALAQPGAPVPRHLAAELAELDKEFVSATELDDEDVVLDQDDPPPRLPAKARPVVRPPPPRSGQAPPAPPRPPPPRAPDGMPAAARTVRPAMPTELPEERLRQLYTQYLDTMRRHNEPTAAMTYETVAQTLRDSSARLREKHGKPVDFEVQVKDGKTILKPVVK